MGWDVMGEGKPSLLDRPTKAHKMGVYKIKE
jgi:hypothetical protein